MSTPTFSFGPGQDLPAEPAAPAAAGGGASVIDTTTQTFAEDVMKTSLQKVVLVDFWAPWCGPCKQLTPILEKVVNATGGKVLLAKMNIDDYPEIAGQLGVQSIPAVFAFKGGQPVDAFMGAQSEAQVKQFIERQIGPMGPSSLDQALDKADELLTAGEVEPAAQVFSQILQRERENVRAIAGLAGCMIKMGDLEKAEQVLALAEGDLAKEQAIVGARAQLELARQVAELGDELDLHRRVEHNPDDHQARFDLALIANAKGEKKDAVELLVEIVRRDREWNEDGARKQLLQFFEAWGPADKATVTGRRRLSSLLFS